MNKLSQIEALAEELKEKGVELPKDVCLKVNVDFHVFDELARKFTGCPNHNIYSTTVCVYRLNGYSFELNRK